MDQSLRPEVYIPPLREIFVILLSSIDIDMDYKNICINNKCIPLVDLVEIIEEYHQVVLDKLNALPNRFEGGKYHYDKR